MSLPAAGGTSEGHLEATLDDEAESERRRCRRQCEGDNILPGCRGIRDGQGREATTTLSRRRGIKTDQRVSEGIGLRKRCHNLGPVTGTNPHDWTERGRIDVGD